MANDNNSEWHLDKRIPIVIIAGFLGQIAVATWWLAGVESDIQTLYANDERQSAQIERNGTRSEAQAINFARISQEMSGIQGTLLRLERQSENMIELLRSVPQTERARP